MPNPHLSHEHAWVETTPLCAADRTYECRCGATLTEPRQPNVKDVNGL